MAVPGLSVRNPPGGRTTVLRVNYDPRERSFALTRSRWGREGDGNRREPEGNAACGKALSDAQIATVERYRATGDLLVLSWMGALRANASVGWAKARSARTRSRHAGCSAVPTRRVPRS